LGIAIQIGWLVWLNGPFPPCYLPDGKIAKEKGLVAALGPMEKFLGDGVYKQAGPKAETPTGHNNPD
jgi:hypothetical protein